MKLVSTNDFDPFSVSFIVQHYDDNKKFNDKLAEILLRVNKEYKGKRFRGGYISGKQTSPQNLLDDEDPIIEEFENMLDVIYNKFFEINNKLTPPFKVHFRSWGNILQGDTYHDVHNHGHEVLVINYYIKCPNGTKIRFYCSDQLQASDIAEKIYDVTYEPKEGDMIANPPWILHSVPPTYNKELRMSISTNVSLMNPLRL